jgi:hypothetical protein
LPRPEINEFGRRLAGYSDILKALNNTKKKKLIIEDSDNEN